MEAFTCVKCHHRTANIQLHHTTDCCSCGSITCCIKSKNVCNDWLREKTFFSRSEFKNVIECSCRLTGEVSILLTGLLLARTSSGSGSFEEDSAQTLQLCQLVNFTQISNLFEHTKKICFLIRSDEYRNIVYLKVQCVVFSRI